MNDAVLWQDCSLNSIHIFLVNGTIKNYLVTVSDRGVYTCTCWDYLMRHRECKHIREVKGRC
jgi:hypothetical protein